jgi:hypothetical protein
MYSLSMETRISSKRAFAVASVSSFIRDCSKNTNLLKSFWEVI